MHWQINPRRANGTILENRSQRYNNIIPDVNKGEALDNTEKTDSYNGEMYNIRVTWKRSRIQKQLLRGTWKTEKHSQASH